MTMSPVRMRRLRSINGIRECLLEAVEIACRRTVGRSDSRTEAGLPLRTRRSERLTAQDDRVMTAPAATITIPGTRYPARLNLRPGAPSGSAPMLRDERGDHFVGRFAGIRRSITSLWRRRNW
jgi:hypothetical protein